MYYNAVELINEMTRSRDLAESVAYSAGIEEEDVPDLAEYLLNAIKAYEEENQD